MISSRIAKFSALGAAVLLFAAGCSKSSDTAATGTTNAPPTTAATTSTTAKAGGATGTTAAAGGAATIKLASTSLGMVIVDDKGMTLYLFTKDTGSDSTCYDACAKAWPPTTATGSPTAGTGLDMSEVGTTKRTDGSTQVTYAGHPLYTFAQDTAPGQTNGEGLGGLWYAVDAQGNQVKKA
jgi:predicted lipoprotein with Yx(FWY)xxD motif